MLRRDVRVTRTSRSYELTLMRNLYVSYTNLQQDFSVTSFSHQIDCAVFHASFLHNFFCCALFVRVSRTSVMGIRLQIGVQCSVYNKTLCRMQRMYYIYKDVYIRYLRYLRYHFFLERVINRWHKLDSATVCATPVNSFKNRLQCGWKICLFLGISPINSRGWSDFEEDSSSELSGELISAFW